MEINNKKIDTEVLEAFERIENTLECGLKDSLEMLDGLRATLDKEFLNRDLNIIRVALGLKPKTYSREDK